MESGQRGATVGQALQAYVALVAPPGFCQRFPFAAVVVGGWRKCAILRERRVESYVRRGLNDDYVRQCAGTRRAIKTKGRCAWPWCRLRLERVAGRFQNIVENMNIDTSRTNECARRRAVGSRDA